LDGLGTSVLIGVAMVLLLGLSIVLQIVRTRRAPLGKVVGILSSIKYNSRLCENFSYHRSIGRLKAAAWEKNREKVTFLPQGLWEDLSRLFEIVAEINEKIDAAVKYKSDSYMSAIEIDKLKEPLARCQEQLTEWVYENMNNPAYLPKKRSLFQR
jgi:hypothetical protein